MDNFSYKKSLEARNIVIKTANKKVNIQQKIFATIFAIFCMIFLFYFTTNYLVKTFHGRMVTLTRESLLAYDALMVDMYVKPGEIMYPGDTIYSYIYAEMLYDIRNPNSLTDYQSRIVQLEMLISKTRLELEALIIKKEDVQKLTDEMAHNILIGTNTKSDEIDYLIEMSDIDKNIYVAKNLLNVYNMLYLKSDIKSISRKPQPYLLHAHREFISGVREFGSLIQYKVAADTVLVFRVNKIAGEMSLKGESICSVYPLCQYFMNQTHVEMMIPPEFIHELDEDEKVDVYLGSSLIATGTLKLNNPYMENVASNKLGLFNSSIEAAIIRVELDNIRKLPLKYHMSYLPLTLKYYRFPITRKLGLS